MTQTKFVQLVEMLGDNASLLIDVYGRQYLSMHFDELHPSEQDALAIYHKDESTFFFYYIMPSNNRDAETGEVVRHPDAIETGGAGIQWWFRRVSKQWSVGNPTLGRTPVHAQFVHTHHSTRLQSRARGGVVAALINF